METRQVGSSGLRVSRLGLGTMTWGRDTPAEDAHALLEMFCDAGGTLIDTAAAYGAGDAERIVGRLVRELGNRDEVVIATKAGFVIRDGKRIVDTSRRACFAILTDRCGGCRATTSICGRSTPGARLPLRNRWKRSITPSRPAGCAMRECRTSWAGKRHKPPLGSERFRPHAHHKCSGRVLPARAPGRGRGAPGRTGFWHGLLPWSPLGRGVLTGQYRNGTPRGSRAATDHFAWFVEPYLEPRSRGVVEAVVRAAEGLDLSPLQVALLWVRDAPGVTAPLLGARTAGQLAPALRSKVRSCQPRLPRRSMMFPAGRMPHAE